MMLACLYNDIDDCANNAPGTGEVPVVEDSQKWLR